MVKRNSNVIQSKQISSDSDETSSFCSKRLSVAPELPDKAPESSTQSQPSTSKDETFSSIASCSKRQPLRKVQETSKSKKTSKSRWPEKRTPLLRKEFRKGDIVFATVDGHIPWPAIVTAVKNNRPRKISQKKCSVLFYGSKETADLTMKNLSHFVNERFKYIPKYRKVPGYIDAYKEVKKILVRSGYESESDEDDPNDDNEMSVSSGDDIPSISDVDDSSSGEEFGRTTREQKEKKSKSEIAFNRLSGKYKNLKKGTPPVVGIVTDDPCKLAEKYIMLMSLLEIKPDLDERMNKITGALEYEQHQMECKDPFTGKLFDFHVKIKKNDVGVMKEIYTKEHFDQFIAEQDRMCQVVQLISEKGVAECIREGLFTEEERIKIEEQEADPVFQAETLRLKEVRRVALKNEVYFSMCIDGLRKYILFDEIKVDKVKDALMKLEALHVTHVMLKKNFDYIKVIVELIGYQIPGVATPELTEFQNFLVTTCGRILKKWAKELKLNFDEKFLHNVELLKKQFDEEVYDISLLDQIKLFDDIEITEAPDFEERDLYPELSGEENEFESTDSDASSSSDNGSLIRRLTRFKVSTRGRGSTRGRSGARGRAAARGRGQGRK